MSDLSYFRNQLRKQNEVKDTNLYFPLPKVMDGLFKFLNENFNIKLEKVDLKELKYNHTLGETTDCYRMYHGDRYLGSFYINLYSKLKMAIIQNITDRCDQLGVLPIGGLFLNYDRPFEGQKLTMSFAEVINVFRFFGIILDHLLPNNSYAEISGINSINKDFKNLTSNLLNLFAIYDYDVIKECSEHVISGEQLPKELHKNIVDYVCSFKSIPLNEEIYRSALDFAFYTQNQACVDIQRAIFDKFMSPFKFTKENFHCCSDFDLMLGNKVGAYYANLYCDVLAADLFMLAYDRKQKDNRSRFDLLDSYINNFLLDENGVNDLEAFRKIRGRDFSIKPYLVLNQLTNSHQNIDKVSL